MDDSPYHAPAKALACFLCWGLSECYAFGSYHNNIRNLYLLSWYVFCAKYSYLIFCLPNDLQAYMYGFFNNKRIVLYDTLIQQVGFLLHLYIPYCAIHVILPSLFWLPLHLLRLGSQYSFLLSNCFFPPIS